MGIFSNKLFFIVEKICFLCKTAITISAGKTNLTGSATPNGGAILSTVLLQKLVL